MHISSTLLQTSSRVAPDFYIILSSSVHKSLCTSNSAQEHVPIGADFTFPTNRRRSNNLGHKLKIK